MYDKKMRYKPTPFLVCIDKRLAVVEEDIMSTNLLERIYSLLAVLSNTLITSSLEGSSSSSSFGWSWTQVLIIFWIYYRQLEM